MRPVTAGFFAGTIVCLLSGLHCDGTTGDHRIHFGGVLRASSVEGTTTRGWALRFDTFFVAWGPMRLYADPAFARAPSPHFALGTAEAHCHGCPAAPLAEFGFVRGGAVFQALDLVALTQTPFVLPAPNARNGTYRSVAFAFESPVAPEGDPAIVTALDGHSMYVHGTASKDGEQLTFEGSIDLHLLEDGTTAPGESRPYTAYGVMFDNADGVVLDGDVPDALGGVVVEVQLAHLFDQANFSTLAPGPTPDAPRQITDDSQVARAWRLGAEDPRSYRVTWTAR